MNASEIVTLCEQRFDDPDNDVISADTWLDYVNAAYRAFVREAKWPTLVDETTLAIAAGERSATLPTAALQGGVLDVLVGEAPLERQPEELPIKTIVHWTDRPTEPVYWRVQGSRITVLPAWAAGGTLTLAYLTAPDALTVSPDTAPVIPETYHDALVAGALARAYADDGNTEAAGMHQAEFDRMVQAAQKESMGIER